MNGVHLRLYTYESRRHGGLPVHEWLLEKARKMGIPGGSVFRAMAGYGRHGRLHELQGVGLQVAEERRAQQVVVDGVAGVVGGGGGMGVGERLGGEAIIEGIGVVDALAVD